MEPLEASGLANFPRTPHMVLEIRNSVLLAHERKIGFYEDVFRGDGLFMPGEN